MPWHIVPFLVSKTLRMNVWNLSKLWQVSLLLHPTNISRGDNGILGLFTTCGNEPWSLGPLLSLLIWRDCKHETAVRNRYISDEREVSAFWMKTCWQHHKKTVPPKRTRLYLVAVSSSSCRWCLLLTTQVLTCVLEINYTGRNSVSTWKKENRNI